MYDGASGSRVEVADSGVRGVGGCWLAQSVTRTSHKQRPLLFKMRIGASYGDTVD